ncbi:hypothetical protein N7462_004459 [Penicillium macrosclerotiorum]|uniref:uncharacterized protein n=1 Tax=Penicillium macrosclerotiorum TaxID=303699 RepID=UPI002548C4D2|nr:uncharacterized protein N7462_004459 [Penicillium macrosclerotiorum]KAJ5690067.1 hypothetical protein N7462_004459 [Penicillium macrosclerotiorum]
MTTFKLDDQATQDAQEKQAVNTSAKRQDQCTPTNACNPQVDSPLQDLHAVPSSVCIGEPISYCMVYEGFIFYKADPIPGKKPTWTRVERTQMHLTQGELYKMVQKRANKVSAAQQYQNLSDTRRAHVNQLIHEQRRIEAHMEWSCVYAKERDRPSKARNAHRDDYETVSMDIILMKRPMKTKSYPRTPMGDLVDLGMPFRLNRIEAHQIDNVRPNMVAFPNYQAAPSAVWVHRDHQPFIPGQVVAPGCVVQGPLPRPVSVTSPFTRLDLGQNTSGPSEPFQKTRQEQVHADEEQVKHAHDAAGYSSESSDDDDDDDDESLIFDQSQSETSSTIGDTGIMECDCEEPLQPTPPPEARSCSPIRRDSSNGSHYRRKSRGRSFGRKERIRHNHFDIITSKNVLHNIIPNKRVRAPAGMSSVSTADTKGYRIQRIDDEELRNRLLECESRIEKWERAFEQQTRFLQRMIEESCQRQQQLERRGSFWDVSSMRHCGCEYSKDSNMDDSN